MIRWAMVALLLVAAALLAATYLGVPGFADEQAPVVHAAFWVWPFAYLAVAIAVVVDAVRMVRRGDERALARAAIAVKLAIVPFLALTAVASGIAGAIVVLSYGPFGLAIVLGLVALTTVLMLPTSAYGIAAVVLLHRRGVVGGAMGGVLVALHLVLLADVVASLVVARTLRTATSPPVPDPRAEWEAYVRLQRRT